METPLYSKLKEFSDEKPLRLHIPGHKGKMTPLPRNFLSVDFTELSRTGNLYEGGEPFDEAQSLWANQFGFEYAQFLTGGSTQGMYTALAICSGEKVLLDRGGHRSAVHAMGLLHRKPIYLKRPWLKDLEVPGPVDPTVIEDILKENPDVKTVMVTSPTYCGVLSDIYTIAEIVHKYDGKLVVDGAHGAHFPWLMIDHYSAADVVTISPHKTLPALGQAAVLLYREFSPNVVRETASLFGTSSPSYPIMSSMDLVRNWMDGEGMLEYVRVARQVATLREIFPALSDPLQLDPTRLTLLCNEGQQVARELEKQGIFLEMANPGHLVAVFTAADTDEEIQQFAKAVLPHVSHRSPLPDLTPPEQLPVKRMEIHEVMFAEKTLLPLSECAGKIAGTTIAPYPPGVPVVVLGEEISSTELEYLERVGYENQEVLVVSPSP